MRNRDAVIQRVTRIALSVALLYIVWRNSHWSVALSLSLLFANAEIVGWAITIIWKDRK